MQETISPADRELGEIWQPFYRQPFAERMRAGRSSDSSGSVHAAEFRPILGPRPSPSEHEATVIKGLKHRERSDCLMCPDQGVSHGFRNSQDFSPECQKELGRKL